MLALCYARGFQTVVHKMAKRAAGFWVVDW